MCYYIIGRCFLNFNNKGKIIKGKEYFRGGKHGNNKT